MIRMGSRSSSRSLLSSLTILESRWVTMTLDSLGLDMAGISLNSNVQGRSWCRADTMKLLRDTSHLLSNIEISLVLGGSKRRVRRWLTHRAAILLWSLVALATISGGRAGYTRVFLDPGGKVSSRMKVTNFFDAPRPNRPPVVAPLCDLAPGLLDPRNPKKDHLRKTAKTMRPVAPMSHDNMTTDDLLSSVSTTSGSMPVVNQVKRRCRCKRHCLQIERCHERSTFVTNTHVPKEHAQGRDQG